MKCGAARPKLSLLSARYRKHLSDGWVAVLGFLSLFDVSVQSLGRFGPLWGQALRRYAKWAYETRSRPLGLVVHGLLAVQKRARINRFDQKRAWEFTWAWRTATPSQARTPPPKKVWQSIVSVCLAWSLMVEGQERMMLVGSALLFWVSFPQPLRPAEMLQVGRKSMSLSTDFGQCADWFIVKTSDTKTRERFGSTQMAQHHGALTCDGLQSFFERGGQNGKLFGGTAAVLTNTLREVLTL
jgi:hypothetical protein